MGRGADPQTPRDYAILPAEGLKDLRSCTGIPVWIGWIRYISFIYYGFGMLLHHEYNGRTIYSCVDSSLAQSAVAMSVQVTLHDAISIEIVSGIPD